MFLFSFFVFGLFANDRRRRQRWNILQYWYAIASSYTSIAAAATVTETIVDSSRPLMVSAISICSFVLRVFRLFPFVIFFSFSSFFFTHSIYSLSVGADVQILGIRQQTRKANSHTQTQFSLSLFSHIPFLFISLFFPLAHIFIGGIWKNPHSLLCSIQIMNFCFYSFLKFWSFLEKAIDEKKATPHTRTNGSNVLIWYLNITHAHRYLLDRFLENFGGLIRNGLFPFKKIKLWFCWYQNKGHFNLTYTNLIKMR